jgi:signal transduction histidine kinase
MNLVTRLMIFFVVIAIIPAAIVGYFAYENGRRAIQEEVVDRLVSVSSHKEAMFNDWVLDKNRSLMQLATHPLMREYAAALVVREKTDPDYQVAYRSILREQFNPAIEEIGFLELFILRADNGLILISTDGSQEGKYRENQPYFIEGKENTFVQNTYYSVTRQTLAMTIGTPISDGEGNLIAVLAGHVDLSELSELMTGLGQAEDAYLVSKLNFFVTDPKLGDGYALERTVFTGSVQAGLAGNNGVGFYNDYRGVPVIAAYRWIPAGELCLITEVERAEAFTAIADLRWTVFAISLAVGIFAALCGYLVARTVTKPVRELVAGTEQIGKGNLKYRVATAAKDEIGELSRAFDRMTERLTEALVSRNELAKEVSERKRAEHELKETVKELERSNADLGQFAYVASHDLQEPLRMVASYTQLLAMRYKDKLEGDAIDFINYAVDGAKRMQQLIDGLLLYSRVGTRGKSFKPTDSEVVLQASLANLDVAIHESGTVVTHGHLPSVIGDEGQLTALFQNLIGNAIKFQESGKLPRIHISAKKDSDELVFSVKDNGIGIDPKYFERIFVIFQRLHRDEYPGTGAGLAIAKKIVDRHGGRIWVESEPGKGSTFYFTIPTTRA